MRIAIIGQQDFGKAALEAFRTRGDSVEAVFCAPEKPGARPDPLRAAALAAGVPVHQFPSLKSSEARDTLQSLRVDLGVMAYVLQFAPQEFVNVPRLGTIQYHPSLLPRYRGPSSINWPIIRGETRTGLTIFRPTDGLDEGPVLLQKEVDIGPDDTLGTVYFERLFPMGVQALLEAADLVANGRASPQVQDENAASYEGWCRSAEAHINWNQHVDRVYDLIRACNPAPGAWSTLDGKPVQIFDARKHPWRRFADVRGRVGSVTAIGPSSLFISAQGGEIEVMKLRHAEGKKVSAEEFCAEHGLAAGTLFGT